MSNLPSFANARHKAKKETSGKTTQPFEDTRNAVRYKGAIDNFNSKNQKKKKR